MEIISRIKLTLEVTKTGLIDREEKGFEKKIAEIQGETKESVETIVTDLINSENRYQQFKINKLFEDAEALLQGEAP